MLVTLAIDSAFSIVEGVSASISDKFHLNPRKTTKVICLVAAVISFLYATKAGLAWLDIVDHWTNMINLILIGILECIAIGWCFNLDKVLHQINRNTVNFKMPRMWFRLAIRYIAPIALIILFCWNMYDLFVKNNGNYGYAMWAECIGGWLVSALVFISGFIVKLIVNHKKKNGFVENEIIWSDDDEK